MKSWLSAAEIAAAALPGLPATKRAIAMLAEREGWDAHAWLARPRAGKGGGCEYSIDLLPVEARAAYVARHAGAAERTNNCAPLVIAAGRATPARDARLAIVALADRFAAQAGLLRERADRHFCDRYNNGTLAVAFWIAHEVKRVTPRTLLRWRNASRRGDWAKLAVDRGAARRGTGTLDRAEDGAVKTYILALIAKQPQLTAQHIRALVADKFAAVSAPPVRTFQHALKAWRADYRVEIESIRNPDGFKSTMRFAARVAQPASRLNEVWQIDASPADMLCVDGRHSIYVCEDIYSRRLTALVTKTPRASAVGLLLRKAVLAWGVPERIKTDNGSDFVAHASKRLLAALAIEHEMSAPFQPQQKGHVERAIGTLQHGLMRTLPGFIGHSVADRKVIETRKAFAARLGEAPEDTFAVSLTAAELQSRVDDWCATVYGHAAHAGLSGRSPFAVAASAPGAVRRIEDARALDVLLMPVAGKEGLRTVTKTGLRVAGVHYLAGFLDAGATALVRLDPADMGRVYCFAPDGLTFLGEAIAPELAGVDPAAAIAAARAEQKRLIDARMAEVRREARAIKAKDFAPAILRQAQRAADTLIEFPKRAEAHDTPALDAARRAADRDEAPGHSAEIVALSARLQAEAAVPANVLALRDEETPHRRWRRARAIEAALAEGGEASPEDLLWLGGYRQGPEYRGFALTYGESESNPAVGAV